jgi:hypothetical protein
VGIARDTKLRLLMYARRMNVLSRGSARMLPLLVGGHRSARPHERIPV